MEKSTLEQEMIPKYIHFTNKANTIETATPVSTLSTYDTFTTKTNPTPLVYKKNVIKPKIHIGRGRTNGSKSPMNHSSSTGNVFNKISISPTPAFINIEDLLLLEEKFTQVLISIHTQSPNLFNECFELLNYYNTSSLYNKFEDYFKDDESKNIIHTFILLMVYSIILVYDISLNKIFLNKILQHVLEVIKKNHNSYLLLCEYILSKISSTAQGNIWVKKLRDMLSTKLTHIDFYNNKEYMQYSLSNKSINDSVTEIKFYYNQISRIIRIILKNYSESKLIEDFVKYFKMINTLTTDELNAFYRKKVYKVLNKNASVLGSDISPQEASQTNSIVKAPYLNKESVKEFTLVLDLDETLICFKIDPTDEKKGILRFRPFIDEFLDRVTKYYELVIFTSATKEYADPIIDAIEQTNLYFDYRLYRQHAIIYNNDFVKDISRLGRDLSKMIIVDNMPQNFRLQKENGIFIKAFWGEDAEDKALLDLAGILEGIATKFKDVRKGIASYKDDIMNKVTSNFLRNSTIA